MPLFGAVTFIESSRQNGVRVEVEVRVNSLEMVKLKPKN